MNVTHSVDDHNHTAHTPGAPPYARLTAGTKHGVNRGVGHGGRREPIHATENGTEIVRVPLKGGLVATLDREDFERLIASGLSDQWFLVSDGKGRIYVRAARPHRRSSVAVARAVVDAGRGEVVRYRDDDPFNLRNANLTIEGGPAKWTPIPSLPLLPALNADLRPRRDA